jgi:hypothetical protein
MGDAHEHDRGMVTMFAAVIQEERDDKEDVNGEKDKKIKGLFQYMCGSYHTLPFSQLIEFYVFSRIFP